MKEEKKVNHLSIFLIKETYATNQQALKIEACDAPVEIAIAGHGAGQLFIKKTPPQPPKWSGLFKEYLAPKDLAVPGVAAAFFIQINGRAFVLAFGQGGRFLLRDDVIEERFGLLCALNAVDPKTFRCVDVQSLNAIESHMRIQSGQETTPDQFGLSVEQDMLKAIVGAPSNQALGNRMAGSDALSVSVRLELSDLPFLLDRYRQLFEAELNAEDYQWVNNISTTKSAAIISVLEGALEAKLVAGQFDGIWLSIPEIIEWTTVKGFMYSPYGKGSFIRTSTCMGSAPRSMAPSPSRSFASGKFTAQTRTTRRFSNHGPCSSAYMRRLNLMASRMCSTTENGSALQRTSSNGQTTTMQPSLCQT